MALPRSGFSYCACYPPSFCAASVHILQAGWLLVLLPSWQLLQVVLDELGAAPGCCTESPQGDLVVARPEAVYFYSPDGRGPCFVVDGAHAPQVAPASQAGMRSWVLGLCPSSSSPGQAPMYTATWAHVSNTPACRSLMLGL